LRKPQRHLRGFPYFCPSLPSGAGLWVGTASLMRRADAIAALMDKSPFASRVLHSLDEDCSSGRRRLPHMEEHTLPLSGKCCFREVNGIRLLQIDHHVNAGISTPARTSCVCVSNHSSWRNQLPGERHSILLGSDAPILPFFGVKVLVCRLTREVPYQYPHGRLGRLPGLRPLVPSCRQFAQKFAPSLDSALAVSRLRPPTWLCARI